MVHSYIVSKHIVFFLWLWYIAVHATADIVQAAQRSTAMPCPALHCTAVVLALALHCTALHCTAPTEQHITSAAVM